MRKITLTVALTIGLTNAADAHCYSRWYYPYPQKCGGVYARTNNRSSMVHRVNFSPPLPPDPVDIPLPDMSGIWINSTETEEQLELMEAMDRLRAIRSLSKD
jgi:hypothetical protein